MTAQEMERKSTRAPSKEQQERKTDFVYVPDVDIIENDNEFILLADMPGVDDRNLDINLEDDLVTISGKAAAFDTQDYTLTYGEYQSGRFERSFTIGDEIDRENINASISQGVLRLTLPKRREQRSRRIPIKTAE